MYRLECHRRECADAGLDLLDERPRLVHPPRSCRPYPGVRRHFLSQGESLPEWTGPGDGREEISSRYVRDRQDRAQANSGVSGCAGEKQYEREEITAMEPKYHDPAERGCLRLFYRDWHPTRL